MLNRITHSLMRASIHVLTEALTPLGACLPLPVYLESVDRMKLCLIARNTLHDNKRLILSDMKNLKFKNSRLIPNLTDIKNKQLFRAMNIVLIIGGLSLILTFLFLIVNLENADSLVLICLPGFVFGLVLMILYGIWTQKID